MSRLLFASIVLLSSLLPALVVAAPPHKRHAPHWHGYGFLPGYRQPPNERVPVYGAHSAPDYTPQYWYYGTPYYYGRPGFYRGQYNGGSMGPCWTYTPIGMIWNCG